MRQPQDGPRTQNGLDPALRDRILDDFDEPTPIPTVRRRLGGSALAWGAAAICLVLWFLVYPFIRSVGTHTDLFSPIAGSPVAPAQRAVSASFPSVAAPEEYRAGGYPGGVASAPASAVRRVHQEASIAVAAPDPEAKSASVERMVKAAGGYVAANTLTTDGTGRKNADMTVKVPAPQFETTLGQIAGLGDVQAKNVTGEDITEQVSDADEAEGVLEDEAQRSQARLTQLGARAKWSDSEAARDARVQLAQAQGRLHLLKRMAALATISVSLRQPTTSSAPVASGLPAQVRASTQAALASLATSTAALLTLAIWILAYAPLWVPVVIAGRWARRRAGRADDQLAKT